MPVAAAGTRPVADGAFFEAIPDLLDALPGELQPETERFRLAPGELTAFFIHGRLRAANPLAPCVLHAHKPYATALTSVEGGRLEPVSRNARRFYGRIASDDACNGLARGEAEGDRSAEALGDRGVRFLANRGGGDTVADAFDDLYYLEREEPDYAACAGGFGPRHGTCATSQLSGHAFPGLSGMITGSKRFSIVLLIVAEAVGMNLWFTSAAVLTDMAREGGIPLDRQALLSSAVQGGFVAGALFVSISGIADRFDPRRLFAFCALAAAAANLLLLVPPLGGEPAVAARFLTGALLAGVYPVGMKIAVGWGTRDRGLLVGLLVGGLTIGKSMPYLAAFLGGADWRAAIVTTSLLAAAGGLLVLGVGLGPHHARSPRFEPGAVRLAWTDRRIRRAYVGYLGHMWELFAMWAWIAAAAAASYSATMDQAGAESLAKLTTFLAIALGGLFCVPAGAVADRIGKAEVAVVALAVSGMAAVLTAVSFGGPVWITFVLILIWGIAVVPDSAQFSAIVADNAPPHLTGSLLTFQTALGFALTIGTVQLTPAAASVFGWPAVLSAMAIGPAIGIVAMLPRRLAAMEGAAKDNSK